METTSSKALRTWMPWHLSKEWDMMKLSSAEKISQPNNYIIKTFPTAVATQRYREKSTLLVWTDAVKPWKLCTVQLSLHTYCRLVHLCCGGTCGVIWRITIRPQVVIRWSITSHLVVMYIVVGVCFSSFSWLWSLSHFCFDWCIHSSSFPWLEVFILPDLCWSWSWLQKAWSHVNS